MRFQLESWFTLTVTMEQRSHQDQQKNNGSSEKATTSVNFFSSSFTQFCEQKLGKSEKKFLCQLNSCSKCEWQFFSFFLLVYCCELSALILNHKNPTVESEY